MKVGDLVDINMPENATWDGKRGRIEDIDEEKNIALVNVNFIPEENKNVKQNFSLKNLRPLQEESLNEDDDYEEESSNERVIEALANYFNVDREDIEQQDEHVFIINGDEYWVGNYNEAYDEALEIAKNDLEDLGLEALTDDYREYVMNNYLDDDAMKDIMREYYEGYVNDIEDEVDELFGNRLVRELYDNDILNDEYFEKDEDGEVDYSTLSDRDGAIDWESKKEALVDKLVESDDAYSFLESMFGNGPELSKFLEHNNLLDYDGVAEDMVDTDGIEHFVAYYDGKEHELDNNLYAYHQ